LKSKKSELVWSNSIDVRFESTEHAKSLEEGVVGGSKSREDAELAVDVELRVDAELIVDPWDPSLIVESSV
jgi:hypothetical protein